MQERCQSVSLRSGLFVTERWRSWADILQNRVHVYELINGLKI